MISTAKIKHKLRSGQLSVGAWLRLGSPAISEIMARIGFDWLIIEGEHGAACLDNVQLIVQAMNGTETVPILRVPWNDKVTIKLALDIGVNGVMVPMVCNRQEAIDAVRYCKYPPDGIRGIGSGRACLYGHNQGEYLRTANDDLLIFIIVEHEKAVANIDEIVSVPGIDGVFFGFADYAASLGLTGQIDHPAVLDARDTMLAATKRLGVAAGYAARNSAHAKEMAHLGFRLLTVGSDAGFIIGGAHSALDTMGS